ncbi:hypothetical protein ACVRZR_02130 [Streptococcus entericus]|uniref:hypothetical protein n=1 Tax=Streptococcus entericus TaxID=155680 RepID=UPI000381A122|nr:hypothetical protein [Streptococcus entericus]
MIEALAVLSSELRARLDIEATKRENTYLQKEGIDYFYSSPLNYDVVAYVARDISTLFEVITELSTTSLEGHVLEQTSGLVPFFETILSGCDKEIFNQLFFNFFDRMANGRPSCLTLQRDQQDFLFLEPYCLFGGCRILEYEDYYILFTVSIYD